MALPGRAFALDLFSGGLAACSEGLADIVETKAYCESDDFRRGMLFSRMYRGEIDTAPIYDDIANLDGRLLPFRPDIIFGTFPCKGISLAGTRTGLAHKQTNLFWHIPRLAKETKAPFVFLENNWPGIRKFIGTIRNAFEGIGYQCRDGHLAARDVGARHIRERWFLLAYSDGELKREQSRRQQRKSGENSVQPSISLENGENTDTDSERISQCGVKKRLSEKLSERFSLLESYTWDDYASYLLRMDSGVPYRGKRIGALGDSNPPALYRGAFFRLLGGYLA